MVRKLIKPSLVLLVLLFGLLVGQLPLSRHAKTSHLAESFNAMTIQKHMDKGHCRLYAQWCSNQTFRITCKLKKEDCIGLVVGCQPLQVITGFQGRCDYWRSMREGCTIPVPVPKNFMFLE